jgi:hypothetical protein
VLLSASAGSQVTCIRGRRVPSLRAPRVAASGLADQRQRRAVADNDRGISATVREGMLPLAHAITAITSRVGGIGSPCSSRLRDAVGSAYDCPVAPSVSDQQTWRLAGVRPRAARKLDLAHPANRRRCRRCRIGAFQGSRRTRTPQMHRHLAASDSEKNQVRARAVRVQRLHRLVGKRSCKVEGSETRRVATVLQLENNVMNSDMTYSLLTTRSRESQAGKTYRAVDAFSSTHFN